MTDRTRLIQAWLVLAIAVAFMVRNGFLAFKAWSACNTLPLIGWALLAVWFSPVAFFMAVWIRRIHKEPDVSDHPTPSEVSLHRK